MTNILISVAVALLLVTSVAELLVPSVPGPALVAVSLAFLVVAFLMRGRR